LDLSITLYIVFYIGLK